MGLQYTKPVLKIFQIYSDLMESHRLNSRLLLFYAAIMVVGYGTGSKACFQEERAALLNYKAFLKPHSKTVESSLSSWVNDPKSDCCGWERVTCDPASGRVIRLSLDFLYGGNPYVNFLDSYKYECLNFLRLNFSLFMPFKELRSLDLSSNCFDDWVFTQDHGRTVTLKMLEELDLSNCAFYISIMEMLSSFTSLKTVHLPYNNLNGPFPIQELLALKNLEQLYLSGNLLFIQVEDLKRMSGLKKLEALDLSYNVWFGISTTVIFKNLSTLKSLKNLALHSIQLNGGPLPVHELSLLQNLETLDLGGNQLQSPSTTADSRALSRLKRLRTLDLSDNYFGRRAIKFLSHLPALRSLILSGNSRMRGNLDDKVFANLSNLEVLSLRHSIGPLVPIQGLCKIRNLQELDLSNNNLIGTLSSFLCLRNLTSLRALDLLNNYLSGNISSSFVAHQASLEYLSLSDNNFGSTFQLSSLANYSELKVLRLEGMHNKNFQVETENPPWVPSFQLQYLDMADCQVNLATRTIPTFLSYQRGLRYIDLSNNNLVGRFPNWLLVNNPKLEGVFLNSNSFNGSFLLLSNEGQHMDHLYALDISNNKIQDKLPKTLGLFFPKLEYLNASCNVFDGDIPASIGEMPMLRILDLAYNNLSGELPNDMFRGCILLEILRLSHNKLQGQILPAQILPAPLSMESLNVLMMDNNHFNGTLQDGLLSIKYLVVLDISNNKLSGELPGWVGNLTLQFLSVSRNNFEGAIPTELCENELMIVSLSHNRFSGAIPSCLGMLLSLQFIHLRNNSLTGTIPESLLRSSKLVSLDLGDNNISGSIPKSVSGLPKLKFLSLAGNRLQGQLPRQICGLKKLNFLDLSRNNFTGSIPTCFNNISFGSEGYNYGFLFDSIIYSHNEYQYLHFERTYDNDATYWIPEEMQFTTKGSSLSYKGSILNYMSGLDLSCNQLSGKIPQQIGDLIDLHALNLSHNYLDGSIPESFQKLKMIESLDLSFNRLSGPIPLPLQDLNYLSVFNVSYNNLSGRAPDKGQFATFDESSYRGNPDLSWNISNRGVATPPPLPPPPTLNDGENNSAIDFISFCWTFAASYVMVVLMFITILWINPHWRRAWFYFIEDCLYKCFGRILKDAFY